MRVQLSAFEKNASDDVAQPRRDKPRASEVTLGAKLLHDLV